MTKLQRLDDKLPLILNREDEAYFRKTNRGKYEVNYVDPDSGEVIEAIRSTRLEYPSPIPVEIPIALRKPESTDDRIRRLMNEQREWTLWQNREEETEDDETDFDADFEDPDMPSSPFEFVAEATANIRRQQRIRKYKQDRAKNDPYKPKEPDEDVPATPLLEGEAKRPQKAGEAKPDPVASDGK